MQIQSILAATGLSLMASIASAHGGTYRGPGDTVPPGGAGGRGGGGPAAGPGSPGSGGGGPGSPGSGTPGLPGGPGGPGNPSTPGGLGDPSVDLTQWSFWWEFNKDPYLNLKQAIHADAPQTGSGGYFLGRGQKDQSKKSRRPTDAQIRQTIVPALLEALAGETNNDIVTGCLVALAKIGDERVEDGDSEFEGVISAYLTDANQEISETAAVALGILANEKSIQTLSHLLFDDAEGRRMTGRREINFRTRAFAAFGLGMIGARTVEEERRQEIVKLLVEAIASDDTKSRDLKVAAIISLGLVPLETIEPEGWGEEGAGLVPHASRYGQIDYLLSFLADRNHDYLVRAHVPRALALLLAELPGEGEPASPHTQQKERVVRELLGLFSKSSKERNEVKASAILAVGMLGDADGDGIDRDIRRALAHVPEDHTDAQVRNFSLIAMAQVGSRPGRYEGREEGAHEAAAYILKQLSRGQEVRKPWAGLSSGLMGRRLAAADFGAESATALARALYTALKREKNAQRLGAYAIGAGIAADREAQPLLLERLEQVREEEARGYIALALGLGNVRAAIGPIERIIEESQYRPNLLKQAAVALGLLGDKELVPKLTDMLGQASSLATQAAISSALGFIGDTESVAPLVEMLGDDSLSATARGFAAVSLGIVADKEPLPWNSKIAVDLNYRASTGTLTDAAGGTWILDIL